MKGNCYADHPAIWGMLFLCALNWGCSTDVALNAPYEERTLAFCLLDPAADEQWVRVNRTWLGEGNNLEFALIPDSSEYADGEVIGGDFVDAHIPCVLPGCHAWPC